MSIELITAAARGREGRGRGIFTKKYIIILFMLSFFYFIILGRGLRGGRGGEPV